MARMSKEQQLFNFVVIGIILFIANGIHGCISDSEEDLKITKKGVSTRSVALFAIQDYADRLGKKARKSKKELLKKAITKEKFVSCYDHKEMKSISFRKAKGFVLEEDFLLDERSGKRYDYSDCHAFF